MCGFTQLLQWLDTNLSYLVSRVDASAVPDAYYGQGQGDILLDYFFCDGTQERLLDCSHVKANSDICSHAADAGVNCSGERGDNCPQNHST